MFMKTSRSHTDSISRVNFLIVQEFSSQTLLGFVAIQFLTGYLALTKLRKEFGPKKLSRSNIRWFF